MSDEEVRQWVAADRAKLTAGDADFMVYASLHELHNANVSADRLNVARAGLSKALNSTARWAPAIVNPRHQWQGHRLRGEDKNLHVEPIVWTFEWAQRHYGYADTVSN